jgi:hypothetical protein
MKTLYFTLQQQIENCRTFLRYWETLPDENIQPNLHIWANHLVEPKYDCGTIACAGGWLPAMPEFAAMGIVPSKVQGQFGSPVLDTLDALELALLLFGNDRLFSRRSHVEGHDATDKMVVRHRFEDCILELENCIEETQLL